MPMQNTMVHLEPEQKAALQARAELKGSTMSSEIRRAIDLYLKENSISKDELDALDHMSRVAQRELERMANRLDETNTKLDAIFEEIEHLHRNAA